MNVYEDANSMRKEVMDNALRSMSAVTKGLQQVAAETTDFTKRSYERQTSMMERLFQAGTLDKSIELQNQFARDAYQSWMEQATRMGELYAEIVTEAYGPYERAASDLGAAGTNAAKHSFQAAEKVVNDAETQAA